MTDLSPRRAPAGVPRGRVPHLRRALRDRLRRARRGRRGCRGRGAARRRALRHGPRRRAAARATSAWAWPTPGASSRPAPGRPLPRHARTARGTTPPRSGWTATFVEATAHDLPYEDDAVDAIVTRGVLHHLHDVPAALAEWRRVVRPGGPVLVLSEPTPWADRVGGAAARAALAGLRLARPVAGAPRPPPVRPRRPGPAGAPLLGPGGDGRQPAHLHARASCAQLGRHAGFDRRDGPRLWPGLDLVGRRLLRAGR